MNAIKFLIKEHDQVRTALVKLSHKSLRNTTKKTLFDAVCRDLIRHETMEETIWYPHIRGNKKLHSRIKHLISEEKSAAKEINRIKKIKITEDAWEKHFLKFKNDVEHHAAEEETKLFPNVEDILSEDELEEIGKKMRKFKQKFKEKEKA